MPYIPLKNSLLRKRQCIATPKPAVSADAIGANGVAASTSGAGGVALPVALSDTEIELRLNALQASNMLPDGLSVVEARRRLKALQAARQREFEVREEREAKEKALNETENTRRAVEHEALRISEVQQQLALRRAELCTLVDKLGIPHLVHFTRCENLSSILQNGLHSVISCRKNGIHAAQNDRIRLDGRPEGISVSVTLPNYRMFYKYRQRLIPLMPVAPHLVERRCWKGAETWSEGHAS